MLSAISLIVSPKCDIPTNWMEALLAPVGIDDDSSGEETDFAMTLH